MSIDITSIENSRLRQAAQAADSNDGANGYNKKLDNSEFNVFIKQASKLGVSSEEIMGIVPMDSIDQQTKKTVEELQNLENARRNLENAQRELTNRKNHYEQMLDDIDEAGTKRTLETGADLA